MRGSILTSLALTMILSSGAFASSGRVYHSKNPGGFSWLQTRQELNISCDQEKQNCSSIHVEFAHSADRVDEAYLYLDGQVLEFTDMDYSPIYESEKNDARAFDLVLNTAKDPSASGKDPVLKVQSGANSIQVVMYENISNETYETSLKEAYERLVNEVGQKAADEKIAVYFEGEIVLNIQGP